MYRCTPVARVSTPTRADARMQFPVSNYLYLYSSTTIAKSADKMVPYVYSQMLWPSFALHKLVVLIL